MNEELNENKLKWDQFFFPNIPIYRAKLPEDCIQRLWEYIRKAKINCNNQLAGNIGESLDLVDEDNFFMNNVLDPISKSYIHDYRFFGVHWSRKQNSHSPKSLVLNKFWVNFQNKHEFNPNHNHSGLISFVIWMKIPTHYKDQKNLSISKNSNTPSASDFEFIYSDMLGNVQVCRIQMSPEDEGQIVIFPSQLRHQVYPFYECDEQRISISGNVSWDSLGEVEPN